MKLRHLTGRLAALFLALVIGLMPSLTVAAAPELLTGVKFTGVIDAVPAADDAPWQIAGQTVTVNAATRIRLIAGPAAAGKWAVVDARRLADDTLVALTITVVPPEVRLKGPITARPDDGIGAWTIAGQTIQVTAETVISERGGPVTVGSWAEVFAIEDPAGVLTAVRMRGVESAENIEVYGAIQAFSDASWTLSSIVVPANGDTHVVSEPQAGLLAHAVAAPQDDGSLLALVFRVTWQEIGRIRQPIVTTGVIETLPAEGLTGDWTVSGRVIQVTDTTVIIQIKGLVEVGARVHVMGWLSGDKIVATQITVLTSPSGTGRPFQLRGTIEAMPEHGVLGTWVINGQAIEITRQTRIHGAANARLGAPAEAAGLQTRDGVRLTTWLRIQDRSGPGPQPTTSVTPNPSRTPSVTPEPSGTPGGGGPQPSRTPGRP